MEQLTKLEQQLVVTQQRLARMREFLGRFEKEPAAECVVFVRDDHVIRAFRSGPGWIWLAGGATQSSRGQWPDLLRRVLYQDNPPVSVELYFKEDAETLRFGRRS